MGGQSSTWAPWWAQARDGAFERDALRDAEVVVNGYRPVRFTRRAVKYDQGYVEGVMRRILST
jgi:hypothetical protein